MEELKIHSEGEEDHLKAIMEKYDQLKKSLTMNPKLSMKEKEAALNKLDGQLVKDKLDSKQNLY